MLSSTPLYLAFGMPGPWEWMGLIGLLISLFLLRLYLQARRDRV